MTELHNYSKNKLMELVGKMSDKEAAALLAELTQKKRANSETV